MSSRGLSSRGLWVLGTLAAGGMIAFGVKSSAASQRTPLVVMTVLLLGFLYSEIRRIRAEQPERWLLSPVVMASIMTFGISFGVANFLYFLPAPTLELVGLTPYVSYGMVKLMWLVLLAAIAMWIGYRSHIAKALGSRLARGTRHRWIRCAPKPHALAVPCLALLAIGARLLQVRLGVFGYASNYGALIEMGRYTQYLALMASLGQLALLLAALTFYRNPRSRYYRILLAGTLVVEIGFGLLSGFKSQVAMPLVTVGACYYLTHGRIPFIWIGGFILAIVLAFAAIEPYRDLRNSQYVGEDESMFAIAESMTSAQEGPSIKTRARAPTWLLFLARSSSIHDASLGVDYKDSGSTMPPGSPEFLRNLVMSPVYAVVPRLLLPSKPVGNMGLWYTHVVVGRDIMSSTASSPFTYLYFAGGSVGVVAFFGLLGLSLRIMSIVLRPTDSVAASLVYVVLLAKVAGIPSDVDGLVVDIVRTVPMVLFLQLLLFPRRIATRVHALASVSSVAERQDADVNSRRCQQTAKTPPPNR